MNIWNRLAWMYDRMFTPALNRDIPIIKELGEFKKTDTVLDFGGGTGRVAVAIKNEVREVIVLDVSPKMAARARKKGIEAEISSRLPTRFPDASIDTVLVIEALHHMPNPEAHITEFARLLKAEGLLIIEEPNPRHVLGRVLFRIERLFETVTYVTPEELQALLIRHGFAVERSVQKWFSYFTRARKN